MLSFFFLAGGGEGLCAQVIHLEGDSWEPYVMDAQADRPGFMVEVVTKALGKAGFSVDFKVIPWTRALADTASGKADGIVGIYFDQALKKHFIVPEEEAGISVNHLFVLRSSSWVYSGPRSLETQILGTIADYDYGELTTYIEDQIKSKSGRVQVVFGNDALQSNLRKLAAGRVTVIIEDALVAVHEARILGYLVLIKSAGTVRPANKVGIAFSAKNPQAVEWAQMFDRGMRALRQSGELKSILDKYGVSDWK